MFILSGINNGVRMATVRKGWVWHAIIFHCTCYCTCDGTDLKNLCRLTENKKCQPPVFANLYINGHRICADLIMFFFVWQSCIICRKVVFVEICRNFRKMGPPWPWKRPVGASRLYRSGSEGQSLCGANFRHFLIYRRRKLRRPILPSSQYWSDTIIKRAAGHLV